MAPPPAADDLPMEHFGPISAISEAIQLAVAPVFLLTGIGAIVSVMTTRLGRAVDRVRLVERRLPQVSDDDYQGMLQREASTLWMRIRVINWAIRLAVSSALTICLVVMSLFVGDVALFNMGTVISFLFVLAMGLLVLGLLLLLYEVSISTRNMLQGAEHLFADDR